MSHRLRVKYFESCKFGIIAIEVEFIMTLIDRLLEQSA
jgi:hypothetical protein